MGLDNHWVDKNGQPTRVEGDFRLCAGLFTDDGNSSFRGKVYNAFIVDATGESLYSPLSPETIETMATQLEDLMWSENYVALYDIDEDEFGRIKAMFRAHANAGNGLRPCY